jgi:diguanylate cyclase (GGDEF)-like protein
MSCGCTQRQGPTQAAVNGTEWDIMFGLGKKEASELATSIEGQTELLNAPTPEVEGLAFVARRPQPLVFRGELNVRFLLGCLVLAGLAGVVYGFSIAGVSAPSNGLALPIAAVLIGFALTARFRIVEQIGATTHVFHSTEVPLIAGLFTIRPSLIVGLAIIGTAIGASLDRNATSMRVLSTAVFTVSEVVLITGLFSFFANDRMVLHTETWVTLLGIIVGVRLVRTIVELALTALSGAEVPLGQAAGTVILAVLGSLSMSGVAIVGVMVSTQSRLAVLLIVAVIAVPLAVYRSYVLVRDRLVRVRLLQDFTAGFARSVDRSYLLSDIANRACEVMGARTAVLLLDLPDLSISEIVHSQSSTIGNAFPVAEPEAYPSVGDWLWSRTSRTRKITRLGIRLGSTDAATYLQSIDARTLLASPLIQNDELLGLLCVCDRLPGIRDYSAADAELFATVADHTAVVLHGHRLQERVRDEAEERARSAMMDSLTGLPNRGALGQRVDELCGSLVSEGPTSAALLTLDLNRFKEINSVLGHHAADALIKGVADRIREIVPRSATVARLGGDEISVLLPDVPSRESAMAASLAVQEAVRTEVIVGDLTIVTDCAIGIALIPDHGREQATLMRRADVAMYAAKQHPEGTIVIFDPTQEEASSRQAGLVHDLRIALEQNALAVHFQPKAQLRDGAIVGVEALVRWQHPELGFIPPDEFISLAEHAGLIFTLTDFVLREALAQCQTWQVQGLNIGVAVNLSARSLRIPNLADTIATALATAGLAPEALTLEITEGEIVNDGPIARRTLNDLHALGVSVSIDDFGTGYSSLSYLARLNADEVKIDKSFVTDVADDEVSGAIIRAVVELANQLGLQTVAEGVEDQRTWDRLRELGIDIAQGYFLSRPLSGEKLGMWLWERRRSGVGQVGVEDRSLSAVSNVRAFRRS